jgi:hypothetical protein
MFVLSGKPTYRFRVEVKRPNDATGKWETFDFIAEFKRRSRPELEEMIRKGLPGDAEVVASEFVGWSGVKQPDGTDLEVTDANRTVLLAEPMVQAAIVRAWLESAVTGPAKN